MKIYKTAAGLTIMADKEYNLGEYIDGCGTIIEEEKIEENIWEKRDELISKARNNDNEVRQLLLDNWGDF